MIVTSADTADVKLLHIEDDSDDALLVRRALQRLPYAFQYTLADSGESAVEALTALPDADVPDIILLDLNMPRMTGEEFLGWLGQQDRFASTSVIVFTTLDDAATFERLQQAGADACLTKEMNDEDQAGLMQAIVDIWFHGRVQS